MMIYNLPVMISNICTTAKTARYPLEQEHTLQYMNHMRVCVGTYSMRV